ncbi:MAG: Spy/CpxP family protein refolding chaperone [Armatimonadota bacterium]
MKTLLVAGLLAFAFAFVVPTVAAEPSATQPSACPFTEQGLAALSLSPEQAVVAHRIAQEVQRGMLVSDPVSEMWPELQLGQPVEQRTMDQVIAENRAKLVALLSEPKPSSEEIQSLAREIAVQELTMRELVHAGTLALSSILTPAQRARLQECPRIAQLPQ